MDTFCVSVYGGNYEGSKSWGYLIGAGRPRLRGEAEVKMCRDYSMNNLD